MKWIGLGLLGINALGLHVLAINPFSLNLFLGVLTCEIWLAAWMIAFAPEMRHWAYRHRSGGRGSPTAMGVWQTSSANSGRSRSSARRVRGVFPSA